MSRLDDVLAQNYHDRVGNGVRKTEAPVLGPNNEIQVEIPKGAFDDVDLNEAIQRLALLSDDVCRRCVISRIDRSFLRALVKARAAA